MISFSETARRGDRALQGAASIWGQERGQIFDYDYEDDYDYDGECEYERECAIGRVFV